MKWIVRKARNGDWWAHHPECRRLGFLICVLFNDCQNCGKFEAAIAWANHKTSKPRLEVVNLGKSWVVLDHHTMLGVGFTRPDTAYRVASKGVPYLEELDVGERFHYDAWLNGKVSA
jgi:hypothetical protein